MEEQNIAENSHEENSHEENMKILKNFFLLEKTQINEDGIKFFIKDSINLEHLVLLLNNIKLKYEDKDIILKELNMKNIFLC